MEIKKNLEKNPIIFVTKEPDKALGFSEKIPNFFVMCPKDKVNSKLKNLLGEFLIPSLVSGSTRAILANKNNLKKIKTLGASILVFKNTPQIAKIARDHKIKILNNPPELSSKIENKISQFEWLQELKKFLPPESNIKIVKEIVWQKPFMIQWNTGHSGDSTIFIENENILNNLKEKFPNREARISHKINGPTFTNNNIVSAEKILIGNLSFQITGLPALTQNQFSTVGNDFGLVEKILTPQQIEGYKKIAKKIGEKLQKENYRGIFGLDLILDLHINKWFLIEINARQTSSTTLESWLQIQKENNNKNTTFGNYLNALLEYKVNEITKITDGGQIILRQSTNKIFNLQKIKEKLEKTLNLIFVYPNKKKNEELLRIWTNQNIMATTNKFNELGQKIIKIIEKHSNNKNYPTDCN